MNTFFSYIYNKSQQYNFHTNTLGLIRSLLALSSLLFLLFNPIDILFHTGLGVPNIPNCENTVLSSINLFCIFSFNLYLAKIVAIIILIFIILGYFPKFTGILHFWVAFSINTGLITIDGGAQVTSVLTFLIIPLTLTDNRINHWYHSIKQKSEYYKIISYLTILVLKIQIAYIYFDAAISKIYAHNWTEGTALYYFINDPISGASGIRLNLLNLIFDFPLFLIITTYFIILLELTLAFSLFTTNNRIKYKLFILGMLFHILIFLIFGIFTFVIAMFSALLLLLLPTEKELNKNLFLKHSLK
jgi:antimicrobial peptide system SdpB family protein